MSAAARHIVILGAGHAGGVAAATLRASGHTGPITLIGSENHPPYERPPLSKEVLIGTMPVEKTYIRPAAFYQDSGIALRLNETATAIDRKQQRIELASGETIPYDALLITTGARARKLSTPGADHARVLYLRDIADTFAVQPHLSSGARVVVIGAGFIGLEGAAAARKRGGDVTVLEMAKAPLLRVAAPEIGTYIGDLHTRNGVKLMTGVGVSALDPQGDGVTVKLTSGETIPADLVIAGIGAQPNTDLAAAAGLAVDDGIVVDEFGRTDDPNIFAAGDVTKHFNPLLGRRIRLEAWQNAQNQGAAVAKIMAGGTQPFSEVPWFWTDQFDVNLQIAGAPLKWDSLVWRGDPATDKAFTVFYMEDGVPVACNTINNAREMRPARELLTKRRAVDPKRLADKAVKLQDLTKEI